MSLVAERIAQHCERIRLIHLATEWPAIADAAAKRENTLADFLDRFGVDRLRNKCGTRAHLLSAHHLIHC